MRTLKNYIVQRLALDENIDRFEGAVVTLIWMAITSPTDEQTARVLLGHLEAISSSWKRALGFEAAHAATLVC
jgi:hypothetical protein